MEFKRRKGRKFTIEKGILIKRYSYSWGGAQAPPQESLWKVCIFVLIIHIGRKTFG